MHHTLLKWYQVARKAICSTEPVMELRGLSCRTATHRQMVTGSHGH